MLWFYNWDIFLRNSSLIHLIKRYVLNSSINELGVNQLYLYFYDPLNLFFTHVSYPTQ
jgi:hypothetical protein